MRGLLIFVAFFFGFTLCEGGVVDAFKNTVKDKINKQSEDDQNAIKTTAEKAVTTLEQTENEGAKGEEGAGQTTEGS